MTGGLARLRLAVVGALLVGSAAACSESFDATDVADDGSWDRCVEQAGASAGAPEGDDQEAQLEFWASPQHLRCAVDELDADQLADSVETAFSDPESADDFVAVAQGQQTAVRRLATDVATADDEDAAVAAVRQLIEAGYYSGADDSRTVRTVAALAIVLTLDGADDYKAYLEDTGQTDSVDALTRYADDVVASGPDDLRERLRALENQMVDVTG